MNIGDSVRFFLSKTTSQKQAICEVHNVKIVECELSCRRVQPVCFKGFDSKALIVDSAREVSGAGEICINKHCRTLGDAQQSVSSPPVSSYQIHALNRKSYKFSIS